MADTQLATLRMLVGTDPSDALLGDLLRKANNDVNAAANSYFTLMVDRQPERDPTNLFVGTRHNHSQQQLLHPKAVGSPYWMAPEIIELSTSPTMACDIWSLGCTLIELLTGSPPYFDVGAIYSKKWTALFKRPTLLQSLGAHKPAILACFCLRACLLACLPVRLTDCLPACLPRFASWNPWRRSFESSPTNRPPCPAPHLYGAATSCSGVVFRSSPRAAPRPRCC